MTLMTFDARAIANAVPLLAAPGLAAPSLILREERAGDIAAREKLLDAAFGPGRRRKTCERLREGRAPARGLALAAIDGGGLIGTIRLWHVDAGGVPALLLGPLAVAESHRSLGLGGRLVRAALARAAQAGHTAVLLVGDAPYYARFGFERRLTMGLSMPGPVELERFLGLELAAGALDGASGLVRPTGERLNASRRRRAA